MKNLKHINEFLKIYESNNNLFLNEVELKNYLMNNKYFADGEVLNALSDIGYDKFRNDKNWSYDKIIEFTGTFGLIPLFAVYFGSYDGQVCNGGHSQYFTNGYASAVSRGAFGTYRDIDKHEEFRDLFKKLNFDKILPTGKEAYNIILAFEFDPDEKENVDCSNCDGSGEVSCSECSGNGQMDCPECDGTGEDDDGNYCNNCHGNGNVECENCGGDGTLRCNDCDGEGTVEEEYSEGHKYWETLDDRWYQINEQIEEEIEKYIKNLTLDGEKISDLISQAKETQKYKM